MKLGSGNGNSLIKVRNLDKKYVRGSEEIHVLQGLNLDVERGDFLAFMGPSGSGKTTLLNLLGGLDVPSAGSITAASACESAQCQSSPGSGVHSGRRRTSSGTPVARAASIA